jgi:sodium/bile acid cotransporter 7
MVFLNIVLCGLFTVASFYLARPPSRLNKLQPTLFHVMDKRQTIAVTFCAPAKSQAMGVPLIHAMYADSSTSTKSSLAVPLVLYTIEGILIAQVLVTIFKRWLASDVRSVESGVTSLIDETSNEEKDREEQSKG